MIANPLILNVVRVFCPILMFITFISIDYLINLFKLSHIKIFLIDTKVVNNNKFYKETLKIKNKILLKIFFVMILR